MKYLPESSVKKLLKIILYSNKPVYLPKDVDRRANNNNDDNNRSDPNLTYRIAELKDYIFEKHVDRIPLSLIVDLGFVNFSTKTDTKIILRLERNMNKLFESNKKLTAIPDNPDALIQIYDRPLYFLSRNKFNKKCRYILEWNFKIWNSFKTKRFTFSITTTFWNKYSHSNLCL